LNTRKCFVDFSETQVRPSWLKEKKYPEIPFGIFGEFNHGSIIENSDTFADEAKGPGPWALKALAVDNFEKYKKFAAALSDYTAKKYTGDLYQQFFFKVRDDLGQPIEDYYIDFYVQQADGTVNKELTLEFDSRFESEFYRHSAEPACRALMLNLSELREYFKKLKTAKARLVFDVTARSPLRQISYLPAYAIVFDDELPEDEPTFLHPSTTTMVEIVLNRMASDQVLHLLDCQLKPLVLPATVAVTTTSGRAELYDKIP
jgi:hypothetical protein